MFRTPDKNLHFPLLFAVLFFSSVITDRAAAQFLNLESFFTFAFEELETQLTLASVPSIFSNLEQSLAASQENEFTTATFFPTIDLTPFQREEIDRRLLDSFDDEEVDKFNELAFAALISAFAVGDVDDPEGIAFALYNKDPSIHFALELPNPTNATASYLFRLEQDVLDVDQATFDALFDFRLSVVDGADDGASASAGLSLDVAEEGVNFVRNLDFELLQADELVPRVESGSVADFANVPSAPIIRQELGIIVNVSPGDTALLEGFYAIGDETFPIVSADLMALQVATFDFSTEINDILAIPEPAAFSLMGLGVFCCAIAWRRRDR